jgi:hypothetical protein
MVLRAWMKREQWFVWIVLATLFDFGSGGARLPRMSISRVGVEESDYRHRRLLRPCRNRPRSRRAADQRDEVGAVTTKAQEQSSSPRPAPRLNNGACGRGCRHYRCSRTFVARCACESH